MNVDEKSMCPVAWFQYSVSLAAMFLDYNWSILLESKTVQNTYISIIIILDVVILCGRETDLMYNSMCKS